MEIEDIKELAFILMKSQADMVRLEKEQLQDKINKAKERLPDMWAEIY